MTEIILAAVSGALFAACLCMAAVLVIVFKAHDRVQTFLQAQAIDERNERFHEVRSLLTRLQSTPSLTLDRAAPDVPPIEDPQPFISDYEMDDDRWKAFIEEARPDLASAGSPVPVVDEPEEQ